jgi:hypothetical protein
MNATSTYSHNLPGAEPSTRKLPWPTTYDLTVIAVGAALVAQAPLFPAQADHPHAADSNAVGRLGGMAAVGATAVVQPFPPVQRDPRARSLRIAAPQALPIWRKSHQAHTPLPARARYSPPRSRWRFTQGFKKAAGPVGRLCACVDPR